jgi:hypothetical protein
MAPAQPELKKVSALEPALDPVMEAALEEHLRKLMKLPLLKVAHYQRPP